MIRVLRPYKLHGQWVFDDPTTGMVQEAFVGGTDMIIDKATANIADAATGFRLLFSEAPFPEASIHLTWKRRELDGNVYAWNGEEGWLCKNLLKYFADPPADLYVAVRASEKT